MTPKPRECSLRDFVRHTACVYCRFMSPKPRSSHDADTKRRVVTRMLTPNHTVSWSRAVLLFSSLLLSSLELSDTKVYEPEIGALLGTASHFCEVVVLKLKLYRMLTRNRAVSWCRAVRGGRARANRHDPRHLVQHPHLLRPGPAAWDGPAWGPHGPASGPDRDWPASGPEEPAPGRSSRKCGECELCRFGGKGVG